MNRTEQLRKKGYIGPFFIKNSINEIVPLIKTINWTVTEKVAQVNDALVSKAEITFTDVVLTEGEISSAAVEIAESNKPNSIYLHFNVNPVSNLGDIIDENFDDFGLISGDNALTVFDPTFSTSNFSTYWDNSFHIPGQPCFSDANIANGILYVDARFPDPQANAGAYDTVTTQTKVAYTVPGGVNGVNTAYNLTFNARSNAIGSQAGSAELRILDETNTVIKTILLNFGIARTDNADPYAPVYYNDMSAQMSVNVRFAHTSNQFKLQFFVRTGDLIAFGPEDAMENRLEIDNISLTTYTSTMSDGFEIEGIGTDIARFLYVNELPLTNPDNNNFILIQPGNLLGSMLGTIDALNGVILLVSGGTITNLFSANIVSENSILISADYSYLSIGPCSTRLSSRMNFVGGTGSTAMNFSGRTVSDDVIRWKPVFQQNVVNVDTQKAWSINKQNGVIITIPEIESSRSGKRFDFRVSFQNGGGLKAVSTLSNGWNVKSNIIFDGKSDITNESTNELIDFADVFGLRCYNANSPLGGTLDRSALVSDGVARLTWSDMRQYTMGLFDHKLAAPVDIAHLDVQKTINIKPEQLLNIEYTAFMFVPDNRNDPAPKVDAVVVPYPYEGATNGLWKVLSKTTNNFLETTMPPETINNVVSFYVGFGSYKTFERSTFKPKVDWVYQKTYPVS